MIGLFGYNFLADGNAIDPTPTNLNPITQSKLQNAIFENFTISKDTNDDSEIIPTEWMTNMILNAGFNGNLSAGSLQDVAAGMTGYRIKRRELGEFDWITIAEEQLTVTDDVSFVVNDYLAKSLTEYEYAFVPMIGNTEGQYIIKSVLSKFNDVFVADADNIYKFDADVQFDNTQTNQKMGIYEPFGKKYPVVINNGITSYQTGAMTGMILNDDYDSSKPIDRKAIVAKRKLLIDFLNNRRPKIIKDWNSNIWLIMVTNNPGISYAQGSGMGLGNVTFGWTEVGDVDNKDDLYANGMIPTSD